MSLRISADLIRTSEERGNKMERLQKKKEAIQKMSRKERKVCDYTRIDFYSQYFLYSDFPVTFECSEWLLRLEL